MQCRIAIILILIGGVGLLAACGSPAIPATATVQSLATSGLQYRMIQVKTATPAAAGPNVAPTEPAAGATPPPPAVTSLPTSRPKATGTASPALATATPDPRAAVVRIEVAEAKSKLDAGTAILVDVRTAASYARSHALGALSIPETEMPKRYTELPKDKLIILYCT